MMIVSRLVVGSILSLLTLAVAQSELADREVRLEESLRSLNRGDLMVCAYFAPADFRVLGSLSPWVLHSVAPITRSYRLTNAFSERLTAAFEDADLEQAEVKVDVHQGIAILDKKGRIVFSIYKGRGPRNLGVVNSMTVSANRSLWMWLATELRQLEDTHSQFVRMLTGGAMTADEILSYRAASAGCPG